MQEIKEIILPILCRHGATRAGLFGSIVHGRLRKDSDIDVLVELPRNLSLLDVVGIEQELEDAIGRPVDLVEYAALKPLLKESTLADELRIL
jgi:predicted nucleotidyltransferase